MSNPERLMAGIGIRAEGRGWPTLGECERTRDAEQGGAERLSAAAPGSPATQAAISPATSLGGSERQMAKGQLDERPGLPGLVVEAPLEVARGLARLASRDQRFGDP